MIVLVTTTETDNLYSKNLGNYWHIWRICRTSSSTKYASDETNWNQIRNSVFSDSRFKDWDRNININWLQYSTLLYLSLSSDREFVFCFLTLLLVYCELKLNELIRRAMKMHDKRTEIGSFLDESILFNGVWLGTYVN